MCMFSAIGQCFFNRPILLYVIIYMSSNGGVTLILYLLLYRDKFPDEKIPTLEEAVELCLELQLKMFIDVKDSSNVQKVCVLNAE